MITSPPSTPSESAGHLPGHGQLTRRHCGPILASAAASPALRPSGRRVITRRLCTPHVVSAWRQHAAVLLGALPTPLQVITRPFRFSPSPSNVARHGPQADVESGPCLNPPHPTPLGTGDVTYNDDLGGILPNNKPPYGTCLTPPKTSGPCTDDEYLSGADSGGFTRGQESSDRQLIANQYLTVRGLSSLNCATAKCHSAVYEVGISCVHKVLGC